MKERTSTIRKVYEILPYYTYLPDDWDGSYLSPTISWFFISIKTDVCLVYNRCNRAVDEVVNHRSERWILDKFILTYFFERKDLKGKILSWKEGLGHHPWHRYSSLKIVEE